MYIFVSFNQLACFLYFNVQAFVELQRKMVETQTQVNICDAQIKKLEIEEKKVDLTSREIQNLPEDVRLFESVGRM